MMENLPKYFGHVKIVTADDKVHKDECVCSFDTPESDEGLYICMKTFEAVSPDFLDYYYERYGHAVYLHHKRLRYKINKPESSESKPKRLAIGLEGGYSADSEKDYRVEDTYTIMIMPQQWTIPYPNLDLPEIFIQSANSIIESKSSEMQPMVTGFWDGEERKVSKYADNLEQLTPAPQVGPSGWKCQKCELRENLWLNLTDGSILCGRRFYDGTGGNNHAVEHYSEHKYPLAVKLGTITATEADVYSYPEEDMVIDPHLSKHLAHFGIDVQKLTKTEKSMIELEIDMNEKLGEWSVIQEEGKELEPATGAGFTGLINLGNSCYMNSVLQFLFSTNDFKNRYYPPLTIYPLCDSYRDFNHQMAKLAYGLLTAKYSAIDANTKTQKGIAPKTFKNFVCSSDRNFSSNRQQDAHEFLLFLLDKVDKAHEEARTIERNFGSHFNESASPSKCLEFVIEDRFQCLASNRVKYTQRVDYCLPLHVDYDLATNQQVAKVFKEAMAAGKDPDAQGTKPLIPLVSCIEHFCKTETISDFYSTAISDKTQAEKSSKIAKFPEYFAFQMKKFYCGPNWVPKKMDVEFDVPEILDLECLVAKGLRPGEVELEESPPPTCSSEPSAAAASAPSIEPDSEAVVTLLSMGIDVTQAIDALKVCKNDTQRAIEYIFDPDSQAAAQSAAAAPASTSGQPASSSNRTESGAATAAVPRQVSHESDEEQKLYRLKAFISHMGTSTMCGHYVVHIKREDRWYIFNDEKVAVSEEPPKKLGYIYFYERIY